MPLRFAYNTNGTANHRFEDALALIADSGYEGVALTLDHHHFDPFAPLLLQRADALAAQLERLKLGLVIETGARYLLNPRRKHEPTLVSPEREGRERRVEFLSRAVQIAEACGGEAISFWAGVPRPEVSPGSAAAYLAEGLHMLLNRVGSSPVAVSLEPEPGMAVETVDDYRAWKQRFPGLRLALDTGHCLVSGDRDPAAAVQEFAPELGTVTVEDMRRGVHDHLPFGEGDMNIPAVLAALHEIKFTRLICVELSRDSHRAHTMVPQALAYLKQYA